MAAHARAALMKSERERFLKEEWPALFARIQRMNLDLGTLIKNADNKGEKP